MLNNKFVSKNYYASPYPEEHLQKLQRRNVVCAAAALALYLPILVLAIYPGLRCAFWLTGTYEGIFALVALYIVSAAALIFCNINNFYGYKLRKEVKIKDAPFLGFHKMSYNGQFFTAALVTILAAFCLTIFIGGNIAESTGYYDKLLSQNKDLAVSGGLSTDIVILAFSLLAAAAAWVYYALAFRANKNMQYVRVDDEKPVKSGKGERKNLPAFMLTAEEIAETSAHEFVQDGDADDAPHEDGK